MVPGFLLESWLIPVWNKSKPYLDSLKMCSETCSCDPNDMCRYQALNLVDMFERESLKAVNISIATIFL